MNYPTLAGRWRWWHGIRVEAEVVVTTEAAQARKTLTRRPRLPKPTQGAKVKVVVVGKTAAGRRSVQLGMKGFIAVGSCSH